MTHGLRSCFVGDSFTAGAGGETAPGWVGRVSAAAWHRGAALSPELDAAAAMLAVPFLPLHGPLSATQPIPGAPVPPGAIASTPMPPAMRR